MKPLKADLIMFFVTIGWGSSYLFMKMGLDSLGEFNLIALRFGLAFLLAGAVCFMRLRRTSLATVRYAMLLGLLLFLTFACITFGLHTTSTSNAGFLVSLTVVFVPLIHSLWFRQSLNRRMLLSIGIAVIGIAMLTVKLPLHFAIGDLLCVLAAFFYALHITVVGKAARETDALSLGIWQLGFAGLFGLVFSILFETPAWPDTRTGWIAILALSLLCSALGFILQAIAQKYTTPARTGLIFSLEPVFAALFGFWFAEETMGSAQLLGASLVLLSIILSTVRVGSRNRPASTGHAAVPAD